MMRLSLDLRFKLGAGAAILSVILLGLFTVYHLHFISAELDAASALDHSLVERVADFTARFDAIHHGLLEGFFAPDFEAGRIATFCSQLTRSIQASNALFSSEASASVLLAELAQLASKLDGLGSRDAPLPQERIKPLLLHLAILRRLLDDLSANARLIYSRKQLRIAALSKVFQTRVGLITFVTVVLALLLSAFFAHQINLPVRRVKNVIHSIRDGTYKVVARQEEDDEIGQILNALHHMTSHLNIRDDLRRELIDLDRRRFAALANHLEVPLLLVNRELKIAFTSEEFLGTFKVSGSDVNEIPLASLPVPPELRNKLADCIRRQEWPQFEPMDVIGENYAYELNLTLLPVRDAKNDLGSVICLLGKIAPPPEPIIPHGTKA